MTDLVDPQGEVWRGEPSSFELEDEPKKNGHALSDRQRGDIERAAIRDEPSAEKPTASEPLRGLKHLGPIAVVGRSDILKLAALKVVWIWQDIAIPGIIVLIASDPSGGKTTLLFLILVARANTGEPVSLLARRVEPAPLGTFVVLIEGEHSESSTARKLVKSLRLLGVDDAALDRIIIVARKSVRLGSPEWEDVTKLVAAGIVSDIAIDTVARVAPADGNDEKEQVAIFELVAQAIELAPGPHKPVVWAVAHTKKNGTTGGVGDVSGSAQRTGQADSVLLLKAEKEGGRTVSSTVTFAKLREDPDDYPAPVAFAITQDDAGNPVLACSEAPSDDGRPLEDRIVELLRVGALTKNKLREKLKRNGQDIEDAISALFAAHRITTLETKVNGKKCKAFSLRTAAPKPSAPDEWDADFEGQR